jgi:multicomponent Na+:H+ antiporter subunit D
MEVHLPVLQVIIPLIAAPLCVLSNSRKIAWSIALIAIWAAFSITALLVIQSLSGELRYAMGDWLPPVGIEYRVDMLSAFVLMFISGVAAIMIPYAAKSVGSEIREEKQPLFYAVFLLCFAGLLGIVTTNDVFNIYVFLEISSLATYTLIALGKDRRALTSSFEYLILGTIGATFFLIGIGLLYMVTGTLNIDDLANKIQTVEDMRPVEAAFAFLTVGLALKIAMFPLHLWLTNAYAHAPSFVSSFLSASATKVSIYVLVRFIFSVFGYEFSFSQMPLAIVLMTLGILGILVGSMAAIYQTNIKRMLAFSSVAQIGYIILGISLASHTGLIAAIVHMLNHAVAKGALFMAVGCVCYRVGGVRLENFKGLGKEMPWTMAAFVLAGFSLIGIPGTAGFISKWSLINALVEKDLWPLVGVILISSILAIIYIGKVVEAAFFQPRPAGNKIIIQHSYRMIISTWVMVIIGIYLGVKTDISLGIATKVANYLLGGSV